MTNRCYPLESRVGRWDRLAPLALPLGPAVIWFGIDPNQPLRSLLVFVGGGWLVAWGFQGMIRLLQGRWPLAWNKDVVRWGWRSCRWADIAACIVSNETIQSNLTGKAVAFSRWLLLIDTQARHRLRLPFQFRDATGQLVLPQNDPAWAGFLIALERHLGRPDGTLAQELARFAEVEGDGRRAPYDHTSLIGTVVFMSVMLALTFAQVDEKLIAGVAAGYLLVLQGIHAWRRLKWQRFRQEVVQQFQETREPLP